MIFPLRLRSFRPVSENAEGVVDHPFYGKLPGFNGKCSMARSDPVEGVKSIKIRLGWGRIEWE